jgi:ligand-binding sensor domain-containing protein
VVRAHSDVYAVAASARHVFALTAGGLLTYDRVFDRWLAPSNRVEEDLRLSGLGTTRATVIAADPVEDAAWIGVPGAVLIYRPRVEMVTRVPVPGQPELIAFPRARDGNAYVRASGQWTRVTAGGFATALPGGSLNVPLEPPVQLDEVYRRHPSLRAQLSFLLRDERVGAFSARISAATLSPDRPSEVWVGTLGEGLWSVDANFLQARRLTYGVLDDEVGAVASAAQGVWTAGQGVGARAGLAFVHDELQRFAHVTSRALAGARGTRTFDLAVQGSAAWLATDRGLWRADLGAEPSGDVMRRWGTLEGLPDDVVLAVQPRIDGTWVGTRRGLAFVREDAVPGDDRAVLVSEAFRGEPVRALAAAGDQLFVGTARGLFVQRASLQGDGDAPGEAPRRVDGVAPRPVAALAWHDSVLVVLTDVSVELVPLRGGPVRPAREVPVSEVAIRELGGGLSAAIDARTVWIAGRGGVLAWRRGANPGSARLLRAGGELPAEVTDLALSAQWAWVGTRQGLVRVRRATDGGLP